MWFRKFLAVFLLIILIPLFILEALALDLKLTLFNPDYLKNQLHSSQVYGKLTESAIPFFMQQTSDKENQKQSEQLQNQMVTEAIKKTVTATLLENTVNQFFNQLDSYLDRRSEKIVLKVSLKELKTSFNENFTNYAVESIKKLPNCSQEDLKKMAGENQELKCLPPGFSPEEITKNFSQDKSPENNPFAGLPDEYDLGNLLTNRYQPQLESMRTTLYFFNLALSALAGIILLIFTLIGLLVWKPVVSVIRWLATALIIPGAILLTLTLIGFLSSQFLISGYTATLPKEFKEIVIGLVGAILQPFYFNLFYLGGIAIFVAMAGYFLAHFIAKKTKKGGL